MATTYSPTTPVVGDVVTLASITTWTGETPPDELSPAVPDTELTLTQYSLDTVPPGSALSTGLLLGDDGEPAAFFTPDVPGEYEFTAYLYNEAYAPATSDGVDLGAAYQTLASTESASVYVGATLDFVFSVPSGDGLTLRLVCHNGTVTTASLVSPLTRKAELTADDATVAAALTALEGDSVTSLGPDLVTVVSEIVDAYNNHRVEAGVHDVDDTTNVYTPGVPYSQANAMDQLSTWGAVFIRHMTQSSQSGSPWHLTDDTANTPITGPPSTLAQALLAYADLRRCYLAHIAEDAAPASHTTADATNTLDAADDLTALLVAILDVWAASAPTTPANAEPAEYQLQTRYGFRAVS